MSDDFDAAVSASLQPDPAQAARIGYATAYDTAPDAYAEAQRVARRTGVPVDTVFALPQEMKRQAAVGTIDFATLARTAPATAALLADVDKAKLAHDDIQNMEGTENALKAWQGPKPSFSSVAGGFADALKFKPLKAGLRLWMNDLMFGAGDTPDDQVRRADLVRKAGQAQAQQDYATPAFESSTASGLYSGGVSLLQNLPGLAASILTGNPAPGLALAGINSAAPAYGKYASRGATPGEAAGGALAEGSIEVLTEVLPMGFLVKNFGRVGFGEFMTGLLGREIPTEIIATLVQNMTDSAIANPDVTMTDYLKAQPDAVYQTILATLVQSVAMVGAGKIVQVAIGRAQAAQDAERGSEYLDKLNQAIAASKVLQRDPETFEQFVASAADGAPVQAVFIDANALLQSGVADQVIAASPAVASQIQQAMQTGGQIAIPIDEYAAKIAPTDAAGALLDHLKTDPEGFSRAEAQQYMQSHADELRAEVERAMEDRQGHDAFRESADVVRAEIRKQLDDTGRFTGPANDAYATLVGNFFAVQAAKMGITPQELYARYPLNVTAQAVGGAQFDQGEKTGNVAGMDDAKNVASNRAPNPAGDVEQGGATTKFDVRRTARQVLADLKKIGLDGSIEDWGNRAGLTSYITVTHPRYGATFPQKIRVSDHSVGAFRLSEAAHVRDSEDAKKVVDVYASAAKSFENSSALKRNEQAQERNRLGISENAQRNIQILDEVASKRWPSEWAAYSKATRKSKRQEIAREIGLNDDFTAPNEQSTSAHLDVLNQGPHGDKEQGGATLTPASDYRSALSAVSEIERLAELHGRVFVRWSAGPEFDLKKGASSRDYQSGDSHEGLSAVEISSDTHPVDIASGLSEYMFLRMKDKGLRPYVYAGERIGTDSDSHALIRPSKLLYTPDDATIRAIDRDFSKIVDLEDSISRERSRLRKIGAGSGSDIVAASLKKAEDTLGALLAKHGIDLNEQSTSAGSDVLNQGPRGAFSPASNTITLLKAADLSTFLHETGHFFLEAQLDMAAHLVALDDRTAGEQGIVDDAAALMRWFGLRDLAEWQSLDFEEKRGYHEQFARGFEAYLFEGKAPGIEVQGLFQRFRAWLLNVYRDIKALNVELSDEVRGVMDRMLATGEQIQLAEQGRSMMPLFASAERAGMTPEEFAAYQALGVDATNDAIQDLQARGLRDMQWLRNAHGREVKRLQREAAVKRAEVQMEVRREVMSQPVYRAWQFLTGKISEGDKLAPPERVKPDPDIVDPGIDSLFAAIAKLGGINRESAAGLWGVKPEDKPASGLFGKPVLRAEGKGLTVDQMAEKLAELGYLKPDENGNTALRDFEDAFESELGGLPVYSSQADYDALRANDVRPGEQVVNPEAVTAGRLDVAGLADIAAPAEVVNALKARRMTAANGWHPDLLAERFGFQSGDEMVRALAAANPPKEEIDALADQRMLERFGELSSPEAIHLAADAAIHNAARARMIATGANALAQATGQSKVLLDAAREYAAAVIARLKVSDIRPGQYASAESRAARAAAAAIKAGDLATAAVEMRNQLIQNLLAKAAHEAREEVRATLQKFGEFANRPDKRLGKVYDLDIANAARAILGEYGIAEKRAKKAGEYLKAVEAYDPELYGVLKASLDAAEANARPVKEITVEALRGLSDEVDAMLHLARRSRQMEVDGDLLDREEVQDALFTRLEEIGIPDTIPGEGQAVTPAETRRAKLRTFAAAARRVESWVGAMDGGAGMGPFRRFVFSRIKDAADAYRADKAAYLRRFRALFDDIAPTLRPQLIAAPELGYTFGKDSGGSAMNEILHALLHTGNASNTRKLLLGRKWAQLRLDGSLDTSRWDAFVARMVKEGNITKAHMDFVQGVWDLLEETKAGAQRTHRDVFGRYFDEVTAETVHTPWGEYRGGYVPAIADARVVQDANLRALADAENASMAYAFPTTPKGFTKARVEYNRPLTLDLRTLAQHIDKVLLFTHMEMPVRDVQRVLSKKVGQALGRLEPEALPAMLTPWLSRAAKQQVETPVAGSAGLMRFFSVMRARAGAAAMFGNVSNAVQQITGFALAAVKVRPGLMLSAAADYLKAPRDMARTVAESSRYMATRMDNEIAAMNGEINAILLNPSLLERGQDWTMRHAYFLQSAVDNVMGPIIWTAAYNQAVEAGETERDAVRLADAAIRETQGSTLPEDISRIEGGNAFVRLFTQFGGYFNMQANLLGTEFVKIARDGGLRQNAGRGLFVLGLGFLAPAVVAEAITQLFRGGPDDADKDGEYLDDWIAALFGWGILRNVTAMAPAVGQVINAAANAWNTKPYDDRLGTSPAVSMLESAARAPVSAYKAIAGEGSAQKAVRDVATLISMTVGLPANLAARPIGYAAGVADDRIAPSGPIDVVRGAVTGSAAPDTRR